MKREPSTPIPHDPTPNRRAILRVRTAVVAALLATAGFIVWNEYRRIQVLLEAGQSAGAWVSHIDVNSTPYAVWLLLVPLFWVIRSPLVRLPAVLRKWGRLWFGPQTKPGRDSARERPARWECVRVTVLAAVVLGTSLGASRLIASRTVNIGGEAIPFHELPPVYHDEYSYLFQAETFLSGRWSYPSHPTHSRLFDRMHVVNQGRYASRYFPATGAWMVPFLKLGHPYWGHWLAGALSAVFIFAAGRELGGNGVGFLAGMLTAVSPGVAVFSNLLLAHHPALLGLSVFLFLFLRMLRSEAWWCAPLAGTGLSFAMLARPMTAFGFGLPFGVVFVWFLFRRRQPEPQSRDAHFPQNQRLFTAWRRCLRFALPMAGPLLAGFLIVGLQNRAITGHWLLTPYQQFQTTYTPRHVYGFNNVKRAEERIAAGEARTNDAFKQYDLWAENLTAQRAWRNVRKRLWSSLRFTLGIAPLLAGGVVFVVTQTRSPFGFLRRAHYSSEESSVCGLNGDGGRDARWWLIAAAIVALHLVHVPYWFVGIMNWHYVFETSPLWLLLFARATQVLFAHWRHTRRYGMRWWWGLVTATAVVLGYVSPDRDWSRSQSPVDDAARQMAFAKRHYHRFHRFIKEHIEDSRALVLVDGDPAQFHFDYVHNSPPLGQQRVLLARRPLSPINVSELQQVFPDRAIYVVRIRGRQMDTNEITGAKRTAAGRP